MAFTTTHANVKEGALALVVALAKRFLGTVGGTLPVHSMKLLDSAIALFITVVISLLFYSFARNIPGHMLSGSIAYQILQRETPGNNSKRSLCS